MSGCKGRNFAISDLLDHTLGAYCSLGKTVMVNGMGFMLNGYDAQPPWYTDMVDILRDP
jgi:hypothetical protein